MSRCNARTLILAITAGLPCSAQLIPPDTDAGRNVSWRKLAPNIADDQKAIWLSPLKLKDPAYWIPTLAVLGATAGLIALDPVEGRYFHNASAYNGFNKIASGNATALAVVAAPVALYALGAFHRDSKMKNTALLAGEAAADAEILATVLKEVDRRQLPMNIPARGNYSDTWFENQTGTLRSHGSFPSGHAIAAFSVATVIARRYRSHRWVPYVAYGGAALIGFSRMTLSAHFASDVFVGGVLGYSISRFAVLPQ